jgi:hypothetical protein
MSSTGQSCQRDVRRRNQASARSSMNSNHLSRGALRNPGDAEVAY